MIKPLPKERVFLKFLAPINSIFGESAVKSLIYIETSDDNTKSLTMKVQRCISIITPVDIIRKLINYVQKIKLQIVTSYEEANACYVNEFISQLY